jgi:hypothetical protein
MKFRVINVGSTKGNLSCGGLALVTVRSDFLIFVFLFDEHIGIVDRRRFLCQKIWFE